MLKKTWIVAVVAMVALSGCLKNDTQRVVVGAAAGAVVADAMGGNAITGAAIGGAAGLVCDDVNLC